MKKYIFVVVETKKDPNGNLIWEKPWLAFNSQELAAATASEENENESKRQRKMFYTTDGIFTYTVRQVQIEDEMECQP